MGTPSQDSSILLWGTQASILVLVTAGDEFTAYSESQVNLFSTKSSNNCQCSERQAQALCKGTVTALNATVGNGLM